MQSPRTRPGHFATRVGTHQLRGRRARAAHSIPAVAIAFSRHPPAGSFRQRAPGRSELLYRVGSDRPRPGTRRSAIRRGGPTLAPPPTQPRLWQARLSSQRTAAAVPPSAAAALQACSFAQVSLVPMWLLSAPPALCVHVYANAPINAPVSSPVSLHQASFFLHPFEPRTAAVCR